MTRNLTLLAASFLSLSGCLEDAACPDMKFERLEQTDRIVITDNINKEIKTITDKSKISGITAFAMSHGTDWAIPWAGTPVAKLRANFYVSDKFIGDFGVGSNFIAAQGCSFFQSRNISANDREVIMSLLAVKDPYESKQ